jgi:hypothetical protein
MSVRRQNDLPPATDELLAASERRVGEGRLKLRSLKPAGIDDAEIERHVEEISQTYGAHAQIPPATAANASQRAPAPETASRPTRRARYASFRIDLPEYLDQELTIRSATQRVTKTYLIIEALQRAGYKVRPEDLVADRRRTRFRQD